MQKFHRSTVNHLRVTKRPGYRTQGLLHADGRVLHCALGRSGIANKRAEGDGITPIGRYQLLTGMVREDRLGPVNYAIDMQPITSTDGWCDAVGDRNYNLPVDLPYPASHEKLMRDDHLYDIAIVMDFNITRRISRGGSAIFFHLAHDDYRPTEGCVAISRRDMEWLLPRLDRDTVMEIG